MNTKNRLAGPVVSAAEPLTKAQIRSKILMKLKKQKEKDRNQKSKIIKEALFQDSVFKKAKKVMFYIAFGGEVKTSKMIKEARKLGKMIAVPVCEKNRIMKACLWDDNQGLKQGLYGTQEPSVKEYVSLKDLDIVVVPGVAFDKQLNRLGRGKGYYDRFLKKLPKRAISIGIAFDFQILPSVPANKNDISVDKILFA